MKEETQKIIKEEGSKEEVRQRVEVKKCKKKKKKKKKRLENIQIIADQLSGINDWNDLIGTPTQERIKIVC